MINQVKNYDVICLSECWINSNSVLPSLPNFTCVYSPSNKLKSGGVTIYISEKIKFNKLDIKLCSNDFEYAAIHLNHLNIVLLLMYRHPNSPIVNFFDFLTSIFTANEFSSREVIFLGDINIDISKKTKISVEYLEHLKRNNLSCLQTTSTRVTDKSQTVIDHLFVSSHFSKNCLTKADFKITDHNPIEFISFSLLNNNRHNAKDIYLTSRPFTEKKYKASENLFSHAIGKLLIATVSL